MRRTQQGAGGLHRRQEEPHMSWPGGVSGHAPFGGHQVVGGTRAGGADDHLEKEA